MSTVQQRTPSRLFQQSEYRVLNVDPESNPDEIINQEYCVFYTKRSRNRHKDVTFIRQKSFLLKQAGQSLQLQLYNGFNFCSGGGGDTNEQDTIGSSSFPLVLSRRQLAKLRIRNNEKNTKKELPRINFLDHLPKETVLQILTHLTPSELSSFARTSKISRLLAYDDILWKRMCGRTWSSPSFMLSGDISDYQHTLRAWYNLNSPQGVERLTVEEVMEIFHANKWRIICAAFQAYEQSPSIVHRFSARFNQRTVECFPIKRQIRYECQLGHYRLAGIQNAAFVEYMVFMVQRPWHRNEFFDVYTSPIYNIRDFGLKTARSPRGQHNGEFFRRRGYYLKTMENRKVHITYRYFPTIRFRLYKNHRDGRNFLLCQDIFLSSGESVDCYTGYEIIKETEPVAVESDPAEADQDTSSPGMNDVPSSMIQEFSDGNFGQLPLHHLSLGQPLDAAEADDEDETSDDDQAIV